MSKQLSTAVNTQGLVSSFSQTELDTLKQTIARGTTNEQFALFVQTCANSGLNPFLNHIHCIVYDSQKNGPTMSLQIAVEGILYLARKTEGYKGIDCQLIHENDEFKFNAKTKEIDHEIGFPRGKVIGGYAVAKRDGFEDLVVLMETNEVEHMLKGRNGHMWKDWFNDMFKKHIMKRAAKLQYGIEIAEEDNQVGSVSDNIPEYKPQERRDVTPQQAVIDAPTKPQKPEPTPEDKVRSDIKKKLKKLGIVTKEAIADYFAQNAPNLGEHPSLAELTGLSELIDMHIDMQEIQASDADDMLE